MVPSLGALGNSSTEWLQVVKGNRGDWQCGQRPERIRKMWMGLGPAKH